jgi:Na+/proline symporter
MFCVFLTRCVMGVSITTISDVLYRRFGRKKPRGFLSITFMLVVTLVALETIKLMRLVLVLFVSLVYVFSPLPNMVSNPSCL